jgi:hypothetical protein
MGADAGTPGAPVLSGLSMLTGPRRMKSDISYLKQVTFAVDSSLPATVGREAVASHFLQKLEV